MKKALSLALAAAMAASLAACGGSSAASTASSAATTDTAASGAASAGGQTLKVMLSEEPGEGDAFATTLNKWADETGNTVDIMVIPYEDQLTKFPLMAKNNDLPDLLSTTRLARLYPDEFEDLGQCIDTSIFEPQALQIISQNYLTDKLSVLPQQFTITNVFYNKDAFEAAGLECPTVDDRWTMDEVYEAAKKLQDSGAVKYGMAMDASRARYDNLMYMNGGSLVEKDGDSFKVVADSQQNVDTLQSFVDANNSGIMPKAIWAGGSSDNPGDYFKNGDVGIYFSGSWNYNPFVQDITSFKFGVMPSPVGSAGGSAILGGAGLAVPTNAKNKDLALEFLKWFYTDKNFADYLALLCFAQQVNGYGKSGDVFLGISTSGNSKNVLYAATTAHAKGMKVIGLTGAKDSKLKDMSDVCIKAPQTETYMIQELHLPIYHCLCLMLEDNFFA